MAVHKVARVGAGVLAVGLVGYAVVIASRPDATPPPRAADARPRLEPGATQSGDGPARSKARRNADAGAADKPSPIMLPVAPLPTVPYADTLEALDDFVVDLESMKRRSLAVPQPEWVERYRQGNELVDGLMRTPEVLGDERKREDVNALNMRFRAVIPELLAPP